MRDVSDSRIGDRTYFKAVDNQMANGGLAAMIHELLHRDISGFEVRDVPQTEGLADQKELSLDSLDQWWLAVLERGYVWDSRCGVADFLTWRPFASTQLLQRSYLQWCKANSVRWPMSRILLKKRMREVHGDEHRPRRRDIIGEVEASSGLEDELKIVWQDRPRGYEVGTLDEARERFSQVRKVPFDRSDDESEAVEATRSEGQGQPAAASAASSMVAKLPM